MSDPINTTHGIETSNIIPLPTANLLQDTKRVSATPDVISKTISESGSSSRKNEDQRTDETEAQQYIPGHPAVQTIYGWTSNNQIPYHKIGKRIFFVKSELDEWLSKEQHQSQEDLQREAEEFVNKKRKPYQL